MSHLALVLAAIVLLALDIALGGLLSLGPVKPSLTLPFVVYVGLKRGPIEGTLYGAGLGLALDLLGAMPLGVSPFAYAIVGFACGKLWDEGPVRVLWPWGVFLLLAGVFVEAVTHYFISRGTNLAFLPLYLRSGLPAAAYTTVLGLMWFLSPLHRER